MSACREQGLQTALFAASSPARPYTVSFDDTSGVRHSVEVVAESLYEAVILAIAEFHRCDLMDHAAPGPGTTIAVEVKPPLTRHEVPLSAASAIGSTA